MEEDKHSNKNGLFYIIKYNEMGPRTIATLVQAPKLFFSAFFWMGAADLSIYVGYDSRTSLFCLLTGIGDFVGVIIGGLSILYLLGYEGLAFSSELANTIHIAICSGIVINRIRYYVHKLYYKRNLILWNCDQMYRYLY